MNTKQSKSSTLIGGDYGMAPTECRFAVPERRSDCRRGTPWGLGPSEKKR